MLWIALVVLALDQATKWLVAWQLAFGGEWHLLPGFFRLVHWGNTGAAWSRFQGNNLALAGVSAVALGILFFARRHFGSDTRSGQLALGFILGGIGGNLIDRLARGHVVDFLYFHLIRRDGAELGFPAFNVADTGICTGVGIILLLSWMERGSATRGAGEGGTLASPPAVAVKSSK